MLWKIHLFFSSDRKQTRIVFKPDGTKGLECFVDSVFARRKKLQSARKVLLFSLFSQIMNQVSKGSNLEEATSSISLSSEPNKAVIITISYYSQQC